MKQVQNDKNHDDNDQNVDPIAGSREIGTNIPAEKAEQPKYEQYYYDGP